MTSGIKCEQEFKDRAVRLYMERRAEHQEESKAAAIRHVAKIVGIPDDTRRIWPRKAEVDAGERPGVTSDMAADLRRLRRENAELKPANGILKTASAFSQRSSTAHGNKGPSRQPLVPQHRSPAMDEKFGLAPPQDQTGLPGDKSRQTSQICSFNKALLQIPIVLGLVSE